MKAQMANEDVPRLIDETAFAQSLNWSAGEVAKAMADGAVFVVRQGGQPLYPSFFSDATLKPVIADRVRNAC